MNKNLSFIAAAAAVLALIAAAAGYYYWRTNPQKTAETPKATVEQAAADIQKTAAGVSADIGKSVSPDVSTPAVKLQNTDANPYDKANPYSNLKTNPFQ